jgi:hypothetical protein
LLTHCVDPQSWVQGELSSAKDQGEKQREDDKKEMSKKLDDAKTEANAHHTTLRFARVADTLK